MSKQFKTDSYLCAYFPYGYILLAAQCSQLQQQTALERGLNKTLNQLSCRQQATSLI